MSLRIEVLLWAQRVIARKGSAPHVLLEIHETVTPEQVQEAFHKIARTAHPDLHRHGLNAGELEMVTSAYAQVAGAYQQMRTQTMQTVRMKPMKAEDFALLDEPPPAETPKVPNVTATPAAGTRVVQATSGAASPARPVQPSPPSGSPAASPQIAQGVNPATAMSSKALLYYRKAETCLKRGDLKGAILQLKLACATDPVSSFLRTALAEVETEIRKAP